MLCESAAPRGSFQANLAGRRGSVTVPSFVPTTKPY